MWYRCLSVTTAGATAASHAHACCLQDVLPAAAIIRENKICGASSRNARAAYAIPEDGKKPVKDGDLANSASPKVLLLFEGALGYLPSDRHAYFKRHARRNDWPAAAAVWQLNKLVMRKINHISWYSNVNVEIITYVAGTDFAAAVENRLSGLNLSIATVSYYPSAQELSTQLPYELNMAGYRPGCYAEYDLWARRVHLTNAHQLGV